MLQNIPALLCTFTFPALNSTIHQSPGSFCWKTVVAKLWNLAVFISTKVSLLLDILSRQNEEMHLFIGTHTYLPVLPSTYIQPFLCPYIHIKTRIILIPSFLIHSSMVLSKHPSFYVGKHLLTSNKSGLHYARYCKNITLECGPDCYSNHLQQPSSAHRYRQAPS